MTYADNQIRGITGAPGAGSMVSPPPAPTPGKRSRIPLVEDGALCDREPTRGGCYLPAQNRGYLITALGVTALTATDNFRDALQDTRIELLTKTSSGWGTLADFLFGVATGPLVDLGVRAVVRTFGKLAAGAAIVGADDLALRLAKESVTPGSLASNVKNILSAGNKVVNKTLSNMAKSAGNAGKAAFLQIVRSQIKAIVDTLVLEAPVVLTDIELEVLVQAYSDADAHSVQAYHDAIAEILKGYDHNKMDAIGQSHREYLIEGVADEPPRDHRHITIEDGRLIWLTEGEAVRHLGLFSVYDGEETFIRYIDADWQPLALALFKQRTGHDPEVRPLRPAAAAPWASNAWLDAFLGGSKR